MRSSFVIAAMLGGLAAAPALGQEPDERAIRVAEARAAVERAERELERARRTLAEALEAQEVPPATIVGPPAPDHRCEHPEEAPDDAGTPLETRAPTLLEGWDGSLEIGLSGSSGNVDVQNFRIGLRAARTTERLDTSASASYRYSVQDGRRSANRFRLDVSNDWLFPDESPWRAFAKGTGEVDEFQAWDARLSGFSGLGYDILRRDEVRLIGRLGAGGAQEIGGEQRTTNPEGLVGLDMRYRFNDRQTLTASTEYLPDLDERGSYRWNSRATWEILIDPQNRLSLRVGAEHRFDSEAETRYGRSDLDYYLTLGWTF